MNISQIKINGFKNVIDVGIAFSAKEMQDFAHDMGFQHEAEYGYFNLQKGKIPHQGMLSLDQIQGHNEVSFLAFGRTREDREEAPNGIYYRMEMDESGEGKHISGKIKYIVVQVKRNGTLYEVIEDSKLQDQTALETSWEFAYSGKSQKNSTLFKLIRRLIPNGYITREIPQFLKEIKTEEAKKEKAPKNVRQTSKTKEKQA